MSANFITVEYASREAQRGVVTGTYQTAQQAETIVNLDPAGFTDMFPMPEKFKLGVDDQVSVVAGEVRPAPTTIRQWLASKLYNPERETQKSRSTEIERAGWKTAVETEQKLESVSRENDALRKQVMRDEELREQLSGDQSLRHSYSVDRTTPHTQRTKLWMSDDAEKIRDTLLSDFEKLGPYFLTNRIILTADEKTASVLNRLAQGNRSGDKDFEKTEAAIHGDQLLHVGDRVMFFRDNRDMGVRDGDLGCVIHVDRDIRGLLVMLDRAPTEEQLVTVRLSEYREIGLGYATTVDRADRLQVDEALVLATNDISVAPHIEQLSAQDVHIYASERTAKLQFSNLIHDKQAPEPTVDSPANPLKEYMQER